MSPIEGIKAIKAAKKARNLRRAIAGEKAIGATAIDKTASTLGTAITRALEEREIAYRAWREVHEAKAIAEMRLAGLIQAEANSAVIANARGQVTRLTKSAENAYENYKLVRGRFYNATANVSEAERKAALEAWNHTRATIKTHEIKAAEAVVALASSEEKAALNSLHEARKTLAKAKENAESIHHIGGPGIIDLSEDAQVQAAREAVKEAERIYRLKHHLHYNATTRRDLALADAAVAEEGLLGDLEIAAGTEHEALIKEASAAIERAGISGQEEARQALAHALQEREAAREAWAQARDGVRAAKKNLKTVKASGDENAIYLAQEELVAAEKASEKAKGTYSAKSSNYNNAEKAAAEVGAILHATASSSANIQNKRKLNETDASKKEESYPVTATAFGAVALAADIATEGVAYAADGWGYAMTGGLVPQAGHNILAVEDFVIENAVVPVLTSETAAPVVEPVFDAVATSAHAVDSSITQAVNPIEKYVLNPLVSGLNQGLVQPGIQIAHAAGSKIDETFNSITNIPVPPKIQSNDDAELDRMATGKVPSLRTIPDPKAEVWSAAAGESNQSVDTNMCSIEEDANMSVDPSLQSSSLVPRL